MKSLGYRPDEDDMSQMEEHEFYSGLIIKIGASCFFLQSRAPLQDGLFHYFESSKKSESHNTQIGTRCRKKTPGTDRLRRAEKAVAQARDAGGRDKEFTRDKLRDSRCYATNKKKQDLATRKIEQWLKQELERQKRNETLSMTRTEPETGDNLTGRSNCNTLKMLTGKPFGIKKIGARIMFIITVGGHEVTRSLSELSERTFQQIDVYADYLCTISPQIPFRALRALLTRGGRKTVRIGSRYTKAYGPHEVDEDIYTKTMITCDEDLGSRWSNLCRSRRTQGEIDSALRHAGTRCHASGNRCRRVCTRTGHKQKENPTKRTVGYGGCLECNTN